MENMNKPKRREQRRTHLDASVLPVERALLARAAKINERGSAMPAGSDTSHMLLTISAEFTELAEEIHWW